MQKRSRHSFGKSGSRVWTKREMEILEVQWKVSTVVSSAGVDPLFFFFVIFFIKSKVQALINQGTLENFLLHSFCLYGNADIFKQDLAATRNHYLL